MSSVPEWPSGILPQILLHLPLHAGGFHEHEKNEPQAGVILHSAGTQVLQLVVRDGLEQSVGELADPFGVELRQNVRNEGGQLPGGLLRNIGQGHQQVLLQSLPAALGAGRKFLQNDQKDMRPHLGCSQGHGCLLKECGGLCAESLRHTGPYFKGRNR